VLQSLSTFPRVCFSNLYPLIRTIFSDEIKRDVERQEQEREKAVKKAEELLPVYETKEMKKAKKKMKKELKKFKKLEKRERERQRRSPTPVEERGTADDEGSWDKRKKKKLVDYRKLKVNIIFYTILNNPIF
jgi:hypothetical protein